MVLVAGLTDRARKEQLAAALRERALREERARQQELPGGLFRFIEYFWPILEPGRQFVPGWPMEAICLHLEEISKGDLKDAEGNLIYQRALTRLLANVPPGFAKSITLNVFWPAWEWGPMEMPWLRYIAFSYSSPLTERDNAKFRDLIISPEYQEMWGHVFKITGDGKIRVTNDAQGFKYASSIGGVGTGERADRVLCLPGDQKLLTDIGWMPIKSIVDGQLPVRVAGLDHATGKVEWQAIEAYERNPGNEVVEIACEEGTLRCTRDHPVFVQGRGYARADSLQNGEQLVWAGRDFPLPVLQERDPAQAEPTSEVLQPRVSLRRGARVLQASQQPPMHGVRHAGLSASSASQTHAQRDFLQPEVLRIMERRSQQSDVHRLYAGNVPVLQEALHQETQQASRALLCKVRWSQPPRADTGGVASAPRLPGVLRAVYSDDKAATVLHQKVCGRRSQPPNARRRQRPLYPRPSRAPLSARLDAELQGADTGTRWQSLPVLRAACPAREEAPSGASYRLQQRQLGPHEPDHGLQVLPRQDARQQETAGALETRTVRSVKIVGREDIVYNVRVGPHHNYFASGFLTHNCDDPHNVKDAESDVVRKSTVTWFREAMSNRLNSMSESAIVVIMQRVHEEDVSGAILEDGGYCHLMIPFEYESSRHCATPFWEDPRDIDGETAWDDRFPLASMASFKRQIYLWSGQYQQRPSPRGGGIFKEDWWQTYEVPPTKAYDFTPIFVLASLDTAFKEKEENDYSALTVWAVYDDEKTKQRRIIMVDAWKKRLPLHGVHVQRGANESEREYVRRAMPQWGLTEWVNYTCSRRKVDRLVIEDSARGHDLNNEIRRLHGARTWGTHLVPARGDKVSRAHAVVDLFTDGMVYAPGEWLCQEHNKPFCKLCPDDTMVWHWRDWSGMVVTDMSVFPKGAHDDIVDSATMALKHLRELGLAIRREERALDELALARERPKKGVAAGYFS